MNTSEKITGMIVDVVGKKIFPGEIAVENGRIISVKELPKEATKDQYILPGLIDAHVHIESSMLVPSEFAGIAVTHGTVATVSDPHEIANVLGTKGVDFMIRNGKKVPLKFYFGAPSCVPATPFETSGAELDADSIRELLSREEVKYLAEMMNFPGVLNRHQQVMEKIAAAAKYNKPVDGHAPGLKGKQAEEYASAGISTDHECFTLEEARDKIRAGMKIQIREGSAAKNYDELIPLLKEFPDKVMFCSDDKHPDDLMKGHMDKLVKRTLDRGFDLITALRPCTLIPRDHYNLDVGMLQVDDPADFIIIDKPESFNVMKTYINGELVAQNRKSLITQHQNDFPNNFVSYQLKPSDIEVEAEEGKIRVIDVNDGQLVTGEMLADPKIENGKVISDPEHDILKIVVVNRYRNTKPAVGFIHNMGLKNGAMVSTVAHDSHNIIATGVNDEMILEAINLVQRHKGGIAYVDQKQKIILPLPVAGIMSNKNAAEVSQLYEKLDSTARKNGSQLTAPYMSLAFMALLVIPSLKIGDQGLFDGNSFRFVQIFKN